VPKTFAWFEGRKRPPSEYEELTVGLHFGEEALVHTRVGTWTLDNTLLMGVPWEDFRDPAQLHYRTWVALQDRAERELGATLDLARSAGFRDVRHVSGGDLGDRYFAGRPDGLRMSAGEDFLVATT